jgi:hypothetical protein
MARLFGSNNLRILAPRVTGTKGHNVWKDRPKYVRYCLVTSAFKGGTAASGESRKVMPKANFARMAVARTTEVQERAALGSHGA